MNDPRGSSIPSLRPPSESTSQPMGRASRPRHARRLFESEVFGYIEVCLFALLFIFIFSIVARADDRIGDRGASIESSRLKPQGPLKRLPSQRQRPVL